MRPCPQCGAEASAEHRFCPACGFPIGALKTAAGDPLIGRTLGGGYVVLESIGSGGMGKVYRAEQSSLGKTLAVKVIHPHLISDESATTRFYTEARASSRLNHPNSVSVLDFGRTDDGLLYLVMEFLRGKDLAHILWEQGPLPATRAANILKQILAALSEAHELSIIHRDIKPENVLIEPLRTGGDFVKVVDFGLAKVRADVAPSITQPGIVCGTPDYMAPEQGRGDPLDPRSDLYSCGVLLFQTLTGRLPFEAESPTQIVLMHMTDPPPDPRSIIGTIPDALAELTLKALSKDAADRPQSAVEFAEMLQLALRASESQRASMRPSAPGASGSQPCPSCGATLVPGVKFCSECGARVPTQVRTGTHSLGGVARVRRSEAPVPIVEGNKILPLVGREIELAQLESARTRAARGKMHVIRVAGEMGSGKRRLVSAFVERARTLGDATISVGPDITWASVPYAPIAQCVRTAFGLLDGENPIAWYERTMSSRGSPVDRAVRAGLEELFTETGAGHLDGRGRREVVVRALVAALTEASIRAASGLVVFAVEQLHRIDTASHAVLTALTARSVPASVLLVGTHTPRHEARWIQGETITLRGLSRDLATSAMQSVLVAPVLDIATIFDQIGDEIPPLYIDQMAHWLNEGGGTAPPRLVDLVSTRFERLQPKERRALQVIALLGEATVDKLSSVLGESVERATIRSLQDHGWITAVEGSSPERFVVSHAHLREVAEASIPAAARGELHEKCADVLTDANGPLEARALHAASANDPFQALILLERVGDRAMARGDDLGAAHAYRRGLERARRELLRGEIDDPERPLAIFARKLGDAVMRVGEALEAEGVYREGIELLPRSSIEWARLQGALARALYARGRSPDSIRAMDEAVKAARRLGASATTVELLLAQAELTASLGEHAEAVAQLRAADETMVQVIRNAAIGSGRPPAQGGSEEHSLSRLRIEVLLRLARALRLAGDEMSAGEPLLEAREIAEKLQLALERARCDAEGAERAEQLGDRRAAASAWRRAAVSARDAGDPVAETAYLDREARLGLGNGAPNAKVG